MKNSCSWILKSNLGTWNPNPNMTLVEPSPGPNMNQNKPNSIFSWVMQIRVWTDPSCIHIPYPKINTLMLPLHLAPRLPVALRLMLRPTFSWMSPLNLPLSSEWRRWSSPSAYMALYSSLMRRRCKASRWERIFTTRPTSHPLPVSLLMKKASSSINKHNSYHFH